MRQKNPIHPILFEIEKYCEQRGISPTRFGREAVNNPSLVRELRRGVDKTSRVISDINEYMQTGAKSPRRAYVRSDGAA